MVLPISGNKCLQNQSVHSMVNTLAFKMIQNVHTNFYKPLTVFSEPQGAVARFGSVRFYTPETQSRFL